MSYNKHRRETLHRLGIEQLPRLRQDDEVSRRHYPLRGAVPIRTMPVSLLHLSKAGWSPAMLTLERRSPVSVVQRASREARRSGSFQARGALSAGMP